MNKKIDNAYLNQYTDNLIKRGFEIYDEWINKKYSSRKIVSSSKNAVKLFSIRKTKDTLIDALAYLFALDTRIREKYNNILRCLLSYFSWRSETRALGYIKNALNIPLGESDIRNAIAIEIERLIQNLENDWDEDGEDDTHGGKRNGKSDEEAIASEEKAQDPKETTEKTTEANETKDALEEKAEETSEKSAVDESIKESGEKQQSVERSREESAKEVQYAKEQTDKEKEIKSKEQNIVSNEKSKTSKDKSNEMLTYSYAVDSPPSYESTKESKSVADEKLRSFADEQILDGIVNEDLSVRDRSKDVKMREEAQRTEYSVIHEAEKDNITDKDNYLHDKAVTLTEKEAILHYKEGMVQESKEIKQDIAQNNESAFKEKEPVRVPLRIDINESQENDMRRELSIGMSHEAIEAIKNAQSEYMSAQLDIAEAEAKRAKLNIAELSVKAQDKITEKSKPVQISQPSTVHRK